MIWLRGTLPRLRVDQLMAFAWKFLLPLSIFNILLAGMSHHVTDAYPGTAAKVVTWAVSLVGLYVMAKGLDNVSRSTAKPREYLYAE